ncbi:hypothetical protein HQN87_08935 [Paenibacillus tritici]|uniref:DUF4367 domain-containing protein n=1 Tax=Paenibacillus tritici TaxID=1873425 RepID=A0ABX2DMJ7_9BACL|nr:hypothetical protein [Paenibacillus tritici]NQX45452.1 hypothetical protein [Paenibacillus tritici]
MNKKSKFEDLTVKLNAVYEVDISEKVMTKIEEIRVRGNIKRKQNPRSILLLSSIIVLLVSISAGATYAFSNKWNGITISLIEQNNEYSNQMNSMDRMSQWLENPKNIEKEYNLVVDKEALGFEFVTNKKTNISLINRVAGHINLNISESEEKGDIKFTPAIVDFYNHQQQWVMVIQSNNSDATKAVRGESELSNEFVGNWREIKKTDNILALYSEDDNEKNINLSIMNSDKTVTDIQIIGNINKEEMIEFMEGYLAEVN